MNTTARDLGVIVSCDLSSAIRVVEVISKAHRMAKLILRTFTPRDAKYSGRLSRLKLQSLEYRRLIADLLWCYKIVSNVDDIYTDELFCLEHVGPTYTPGHAYKLYESRPLTSIRKNTFFSERVINVWNVLPVDVIDCTSLPRF